MAEQNIWSEYSLHTSSLPLCVLGSLRLAVTQIHTQHMNFGFSSPTVAHRTQQASWQQELTHLILGRRQPRALGCRGRGKESVSIPPAAQPLRSPAGRGTMAARGHPWPSVPRVALLQSSQLIPRLDALPAFPPPMSQPHPLSAAPGHK